MADEATDTETTEKKGGFFKKLLKIAVIGAIVAGVVQFFRRRKGDDLDDVEWQELRRPRRLVPPPPVLTVLERPAGSLAGRSFSPSVAPRPQLDFRAMAGEAWERANQAAASAGVTLQALTSLDDADRLIEVMRQTWGDYDLMPREMVRAIAESGNLPWGAFDAEELVGYVLGWAGVDPEDGLHVHSHMLARPARAPTRWRGLRPEAGAAGDVARPGHPGGALDVRPVGGPQRALQPVEAGGALRPVPPQLLWRDGRFAQPRRREATGWWCDGTWTESRVHGRSPTANRSSRCGPPAGGICRGPSTAPNPRCRRPVGCGSACRATRPDPLDG